MTTRIGTLNTVAGLVNQIIAAFFALSLLVTAFDFGINPSAAGNVFVRFGSLLTGAYGFSAVLIPVFLFAAGLEYFNFNWTKKQGAYLFFSLIPFFTVVAMEKICRYFAGTDAGPLLVIKNGLVLLVGALLVAIEYLLIGVIYDLVTNPQPEEILIDDEAEPEDNAPDFAIKPEVVLPEEADIYPEEDALYREETADDAEDLPEPAEIIPEAVPTAFSPIEVSEVSELETQAEDNAPPDDLALLIPDAEADFDEMEPVFTAPDTAKSAAPPAYEMDIPEEEPLPPGPTLADLKIEMPAPEPESQIVPDGVEPLEAGVIPFGENDDEIIDTHFFHRNTGPAAPLPPPPPTDTLGAVSAAAFEEPEILSIDAEDADVDSEENEEPLSSFEQDDWSDESSMTASVFPPDSLETEEEDTPLPEVNPRKSRNYFVPAEGLLTSYPDGEYWVIDDETRRAAEILQGTLSEFKIQADVTGIRKGPVITMFEILPAPGVKLNKIVSLQDNIALRLAASSVRIVAPIPGKHAVGIEVPNKKRAIVSFREIIETGDALFKKMAIPAVLGKDITGEAQVIDLAKTPHMLIAGATGSGKSVCVNSLILSILYTRAPSEVRMILIDPKIVELKLYNDIPHLLTPVITEPKRAFQALQYCLCEMERRYALLDGLGVRDITSYNHRIVERRIASEKLPFIVIIIDEFADLMATTGKELESTVARIAAMSRAVGIHLVLATQRPSIDVITGLIKANIPTRIAFMVASKIDSRIIIDQVGAEKLLGKGDMLFSSAADPFPVRIQGTFVSDNEVENVAEYVKRYGEPDYIDDEIFVDDGEEDIE
ncbi:MAG: DNA translocase FtsK, partial [Treponema sp.]|nr:DNA translocase FtsK [Treponema sp.]